MQAWYSQTFEFREKLVQFAVGLLRVDKTRIPRLHVDINVMTEL
jgi:hypothetical protein